MLRIAENKNAIALGTTYSMRANIVIQVEHTHVLPIFLRLT